MMVRSIEWSMLLMKMASSHEVIICPHLHQSHQQSRGNYHQRMQVIRVKPWPWWLSINSGASLITSWASRFTVDDHVTIKHLIFQSSWVLGHPSDDHRAAPRRKILSAELTESRQQLPNARWPFVLLFLSFLFLFDFYLLTTILFVKMLI